MKKFQRLTAIAGMSVTTVLTSGALDPVRALTFTFTPEAGTSQLAIDGFNAAGALWSAVLTDNVSVNIDIGFKPLAANTLGEASSVQRYYDYSQVYDALSRDRTSADDNSAVKSLASGSTFNMFINRTANSPYGSGSATPYLDNNGNANNRTIDLSSANAKALGLQGNSGADASIAFSSSIDWDFNRSDGIGSGQFDFVGTAAHEIGHALGFLSGVDLLDANSNGRADNDSAFTYVSPLDLFRYSPDSKNAGTIDWTADSRSKYLSADGGASAIGELSTGINFGDGLQASHWRNNGGYGILSPKLPSSTLLQISDNDLRAFDIIGWNRAGNNAAIASSALAGTNLDRVGNISATAGATEVPEPSGILGLLICAGVVTMRKRFKVDNEL
jgi:hypothetical protein